jgi:C_GCAxxG_C_C family probable redox protein
MSTQKDQALFSNLEKSVMSNLAMSGNCAQTAFIALMDEFQMEGEQILKGLTAFPGIALRGETCGAVSGCLMALGLEFGRGRENLDNWQAYINSLRPSRKFCHCFTNELGSTMCGEIVADKFGRQFDLADPVEAMEWLNCGAHKLCSEVISNGVCIAATIILESRDQDQILKSNTG